MTLHDTPAAGRVRRFIRVGARALVLGAAVAAISAVTPARAERMDQNLVNWDTGYDPSPRQTQVLAGEFVRPMLDTRSEDALLQAIAYYQIIVRRGGWPAIPGGRTLVVGSRGDPVVLLSQRLMITGDFTPGDGFDATVFDARLQEAVQKFQARNGLLAHGKVDERTRLTLNVPASVRLRMLELNLARVREYTEGLASRYVVVNVPAAELETVVDGYVHSRHVTIVGKVDRPTPIVSSRITQLNFNPYWHAPRSIVEKDIVPMVRQNSSYLDQISLRVFEGSYYGTEVDPSTINWDEEPEKLSKRYFFRQEPGEANAMASVRINFPNEHNVYLHDTPTKSLFGQAFRYDSSGCIRVDEVKTFVDWLLAGQDGWNPQRIDATEESRERSDVDLHNVIPLRIVYLTAWATGDGEVHFRPDIYGRDQIDTSGSSQSSQVEREGGPTGETAQAVAATEPAGAQDDSMGALIEREVLGSNRGSAAGNGDIR